MEMRQKKRIIVDMHLPQSKGKTLHELYGLFRKRVTRKSAEDQSEKAIDPVQLILSFPHPLIDTQMGVVVTGDTFAPIIQRHKEVGFQAQIESVFGKYNLFVYKRGKAYLEKP